MPEMFLKIPGVEGESMDEAQPVAHKNEIEIKAWNWVTECTIKWEMGQGGQSTKVMIHEIMIEKLCDKATVNLYGACVTGKHFKEAFITCRKNNGDQKVEYLTVHLEDVMVGHVEFTGDGNEQSLNEKVHLVFAQYKMHYTVQEDLGGGGGVVDFGYNIQKMKNI
jgi:type VI secretion system secreted protein Hcp